MARKTSTQPGTAVTLAALLLPLGAIGDRWGRKPILLVGLAVFGVATENTMKPDTNTKPACSKRAQTARSRCGT